VISFLLVGVLSFAAGRIVPITFLDDPILVTYTVDDLSKILGFFF